MSPPTGERRVVHLLNSTEVGGAEMVALRLGRASQELGWKPEVLVLRGEGPLSTQFEDAGIGVTDLGVPADGGVLALRAALARWLVGQRLAVLHTHNVSPLVAAALAAPRRRPFRLVHTKHGRARARNLRGAMLTRWAARRADAIVAVSRDAADRAVQRERFPADKVHLIYNGIDATSITPREGPWQRRLVLAARLEPVKQIDQLLRALAALRDRGFVAQLSIVGDGSERAALEALTRQFGLGAMVRFTGWCDDIGPELRNADCFVLPSRSEGLSMTLLEAMATGLPVVATRVGGNPEVVEHGATGLLVPHSDPVALAAAIEEVIGDAGTASRMGASGRDRVLARFSLRVMVESYHRLYLGR